MGRAAFNVMSHLVPPWLWLTDGLLAAYLWGCWQRGSAPTSDGVAACFVCALLLTLSLTIRVVPTRSS